MKIRIILLDNCCIEFDIVTMLMSPTTLTFLKTDGEIVAYPNDHIRHVKVITGNR